MAKLSAHGREIGRIEFAHSRKAYFEDGKILEDRGHGWKLKAKVKPGITPLEAFTRARDAYAERLRQRPALAAYTDYVHSLAPLSRRWKLVLALQMMPSDPDGIWSDCCDGFDAIDCDLDDIVKLCRLHETAMHEQRALEPQVA